MPFHPTGNHFPFLLTQRTLHPTNTPLPQIQRHNHHQHDAHPNERANLPPLLSRLLHLHSLLLLHQPNPSLAHFLSMSIHKRLQLPIIPLLHSHRRQRNASQPFHPMKHANPHALVFHSLHHSETHHMNLAEDWDVANRVLHEHRHHGRVLVYYQTVVLPNHAYSSPLPPFQTGNLLPQHRAHMLKLHVKKERKKEELDHKPWRRWIWLCPSDYLVVGPLQQSRTP